MTKYDEYRANAAECERLARACRNPAKRVTWLQMAQDWLHMIRQAERAARPDR